MLFLYGFSFIFYWDIVHKPLLFVNTHSALKHSLLAHSQVLPQAGGAGQDLAAGAERKPFVASLPWDCARELYPSLIGPERLSPDILLNTVPSSATLT